MSFYAVIDTNVLVSALLTNNDDAATVQIISKLIAGEIIPIYSIEILEEYHNVLKRKMFKFEPEAINYILCAIEKYGIIVIPPHTEVVLPDVKDLPFYEAALAKRNMNVYLITGNLKHFPSESFVVSPRQMVDIISQ